MLTFSEKQQSGVVNSRTPELARFKSQLCHYGSVISSTLLNFCVTRWKKKCGDNNSIYFIRAVMRIRQLNPYKALRTVLGT